MKYLADAIHGGVFSERDWSSPVPPPFLDWLPPPPIFERKTKKEKQGDRKKNKKYKQNS